MNAQVIETSKTILQFAIAWYGLLAPNEFPTNETLARDNPYGIVITNYPIATKITCAASISTLCSIPANSVASMQDL